MAAAPSTASSAAAFETRLRSRTYNRADAIAAIQGKQVPHGLGREIIRLCLVRGIRYNRDFAEGAASVLRDVLPLFTRALNARAIMSNRAIPDLAKPEDRPYCIWHPDVPSQETLRTLAQQCPEMKYHVGRACAVAGYTDLYRELDILPDISIAEEARESGSTAIYDLIMAAPTRFGVMNDLDRTVELEHPKPGRLNGDTAIRRLLDIKQGFRRPSGRMDGEEGDSDPDDDDVDSLFGTNPGFDEQLFNLTEDMNIDRLPTQIDYSILLSPEAVRLLYSPLPHDLPTCDKDALILRAAHDGNIDRYHRLRRPLMLDMEWHCIVHGICMLENSE